MKKICEWFKRKEIFLGIVQRKKILAFVTAIWTSVNVAFLFLSSIHIYFLWPWVRRDFDVPRRKILLSIFVALRNGTNIYFSVQALSVVENPSIPFSNT